MEPRVLRAGRAPHRPPFHSHATAVCTVRHREATAEQGEGAALAALAAEGVTRSVCLAAGAAAEGSPPWAALVARMELGEAARWPTAGGGGVDLELQGWIEETLLPAQGGGGGTLCMERAAGVNDGAAAAAPASPLAEARVSFRAEHAASGRRAQSPAGGPLLLDVVVDEEWPGAVPAELRAPLDLAVRCMRPGERAELSACGWQTEVRLLSARNPKPAYDMGPAEKLASAQEWRERGNACYGAKAWARALNRYVLAAAAVAHADRDSHFTPEQRQAARTARLLVALNVAATALQLGDADEALRQSEEALAIDPGSFKGRWRRGKARLMLGDGERALDDLRAAARSASSGAQRRQIQAEAARAGTIVRERALAQRAELRGMIARAPGYLSGDDCGADSARVAAQAQAGPCAEFVSDDI